MTHSKKEPKEVTVECVVNNVWTRKGKLTKGDKVTLPADEAKELGKMVKIVK